MIVIVSVVCGLEIKWVNFEIATEILRPGCGLENRTHGLGIHTHDFEISRRDRSQTCIPPIHGIGPME